MDRRDEAWAVFRCSLLSPLRVGEVAQAAREAYFREVAAEEHLLPNGERKRISVRTLRRWWARLRDEGIQGVFRKPRKDRGRARLDREHLLRRAVELKLEQPRRSVLVINQILREEFGVAAPRSTLYRHLRLVGATRAKLELSRQKVRCRWTRDQSNALWVGDFEHGPKIIHQGRIVLEVAGNRALVAVDRGEILTEHLTGFVRRQRRPTEHRSGRGDRRCRRPHRE